MSGVPDRHRRRPARKEAVHRIHGRAGPLPALPRPAVPAQPGRRAPRHQASEHNRGLDEPRRANGQNHRLRPGEGFPERGENDVDGVAEWDLQLHGAGNLFDGIL